MRLEIIVALDFLFNWRNGLCERERLYPTIGVIPCVFIALAWEFHISLRVKSNIEPVVWRNVLLL